MYFYVQLDVLVNNAGRSQRARWENIEIAVDKEMFNLNVFSIMSLSRLAVKHFLKVGEGQIVNTSSFAGILPVPMSATYCGTKHALHVNFKILLLSLNKIIRNFVKYFTIARINDIILYTFIGLFQAVVLGTFR